MSSNLIDLIREFLSLFLIFIIEYMLNYLNYYFRTNLLFICIVYVLIVLFCSLYFKDSLLCEDHPVEGGSGSYSESELFGKDNNDSLSEEDRVKEFVRMCDMTSSNYYSADYYR